MKWLRRIGLFILLAVIIGGISGWWYFRHFGSASLDWSSYKTARVILDDRGIPTIEAADWDLLVQAQGFVTASDRLWQMDLMRRAAAGKLSEWFGEKAIKWDTKRLLEDWTAVADQSARDLPDNERHICDRYAAGVNQFITDHRERWGAEYLMLQTQPNAWECRDTMLILLTMAEDLSASIEEEPALGVWHNFLTPGWEHFLFTQNHPWNEPIIGDPPNEEDRLDPKEFLPMRELSATEKQPPLPKGDADADLASVGSNNWAYRSGPNFLIANDPHLNLNVPQLWYAVRLRVSSKEWVVGESIPGVPLVVLGMNETAAWALTNLKEDVDDLLLEEMSPDGKSYVSRLEEQGNKVFEPVEERHLSFKIKGQPDREVVARFTHRGPLLKLEGMGDSQYSRQWLAFQKGRLRLPVMPLARFKNWDDFNLAADDFMVPAQNMLYLDRGGNMGYRASGTGVIHQASNLGPQPAIKGEWLGLEPSEKRPRLWMPRNSDETEPKFLATANQRIFLEQWGSFPSGDLRSERIRRALSQSQVMSARDMEALQLDTHSRFYQSLLQWVVRYSSARGVEQRRIIELWQNWDGYAEHNPEVFFHAVVIEKRLRELLVNRARQAFIPVTVPQPEYRWRNDSAWILRVTDDSADGLAAFGLKANDVAQLLLERIEKESASFKGGYEELNKWKAQHPFAILPVIGWLFKIKEFPQWGFHDLVRTERPKMGAGTRVVWDLAHPENSSWITPVGQSGHVLTRHYHDQQSDWFAGRRYKVLDPHFVWE
jgi:penicillin G amidase